MRASMDQMELITTVLQTVSGEGASLSTTDLLNAFDSDNALTDIAAAIADLNASSAPVLAGALAERSGNLDFCLGGVLEAIDDRGWYGDFKSPGEFVRVTCGFDIRQAQYLRQTYRYLMKEGIQWSTVKALGWTKLRLLVAYEALTPDNAAEWVAKAAGKAMTVRALDNELKFAHKPAPAPTQKAQETTVLNLVQPTSSTASTPVSESHSVDDDDNTYGIALKGVDDDADVQTESTEDDEIVPGPLDHDRSNLIALMRKVGLDTAREVFEEAFPDALLMSADELEVTMH